MHYDIIAALLPTVAVLTGILLNRNDYAKLDARLTAEIGRLDARITQMENRFHSDMMQVIGKLTELEVRVARLEEKASR
jgi:hypothetical protein